MNEQSSPAFKAMSDAVLAIAAELSVEPILQKLVHAARELADARYAAIGVPDGEGAFAQFITSGMSEKLIAAMGPLPRTHGLLGAMLESPQPYRTTGSPRRPALQGLVAGPAPGHAVVSRRPDRVALRNRRRLLSHAEAGRRTSSARRTSS